MLEYLVIHSTKTPYGIEVDMEDIQEEHIELGYGKIGYADIINFDGIIESTLRLTGGSKPYNWDMENSRHVAYMGGISEDGFNIEDTRTIEQVDSLHIYVQYMKKRYPELKIIDYTKTSIYIPPFPGFTDKSVNLIP